MYLHARASAIEQMKRADKQAAMVLRNAHGKVRIRVLK